jgi:hypothetical protein
MRRELLWVADATSAPFIPSAGSTVQLWRAAMCARVTAGWKTEVGGRDRPVGFRPGSLRRHLFWRRLPRCHGHGCPEYADDGADDL